MNPLFTSFVRTDAAGLHVIRMERHGFFAEAVRHFNIDDGKWRTSLILKGTEPGSAGIPVERLQDFGTFILDAEGIAWGLDLEDVPADPRPSTAKAV